MQSDIRMVMSGSLSKMTRYALYAGGPMSSKEITNLIKFLELHLQFALEDEAKEDEGGHSDEATADAEQVSPQNM